MDETIHRCECDEDSRGNPTPRTMYGPEERKAMRRTRRVNALEMR